MSPVVCPEGHRSASADYCDVCGAPIAAAAAASPAAAAPTSSPSQGTPVAVACPNCGFGAAAGALFCENCGYDFTTGALPAPQPVLPPVTAPQPAAPLPASDPGAPASSEAAPGDPASQLPTPAPEGQESWIAELWVDPDWYEVQKPEDPLPSVGLPVLVPLRARSVLVGRPSASRNIHPQIDCGTDSGVSRRHCQLNTDGQRWWVEDLQSSNGTFLSHAGDALPSDPITPGQRVELQDGDRIYVGAWTRLVVRHALPGEV